MVDIAVSSLQHLNVRPSYRPADCVPVFLKIAALAEPFAVAATGLDRTGIGPDDTVLIYGARCCPTSRLDRR